jgi:hypothetical protein
MYIYICPIGNLYPVPPGPSTPRKLASAANARDRLFGTAETTIPTNLKEIGGF